MKLITTNNVFNKRKKQIGINTATFIGYCILSI